MGLREYIGQMVERSNGEAFGRVVMAEYEEGDRVMLTVRVAGPWAEGRERQLTIGVDDPVWLLLGQPPESPPEGLRSCVRCRRLNFGPCISATCVDLQAAG